MSDSEARRGNLPAPVCSVIVPAYNAAGTLEACLQALLAQTLPRASCEVIVVDDGSTDGTVAVAQRYPVRLLRQPHAGPAQARNLAAGVARGQYFLFTDADCVPASDWVEEMLAPLAADPRVGGAKGVCRSEQRCLMARFSQMEIEAKYASLRRRPSIDFVDTYAAVVRRDAFRAVGGFDTAFPVASNEDTQFSFALAAAGWRLTFAEQAVVQHRHPVSLGGYLRRKWRHGFWRVPVYRRYPGKLAGDSYTPRSTQVQLATAVSAFLLLPFPPAYPLVAALLAAFLLATAPFVWRARGFGWDVALATPAILFLRALALAGGLLAGALATPFRARTGVRPRPQGGDANRG